MLEIPELNLEILYRMSLPELLNMCTVNLYYKQICEDPTFWMNKIKQDFSIIPTLSSLQTYRLLHNLNKLMLNFNPAMSLTQQQKDIIIKPLFINNIIQYHALNATTQAEMLKVLTLGLAEDGQIDAFKLLENYNILFDSEIANHAAYGGHIDMLNWLAQREVFPTSKANVVDRGHVDVLNWMFSYGILPEENSFARASMFGQISVLEWLWEQGYPQHESTAKEALADAVIYGQLDSLNWLASKGLYPSSYPYSSRNYRAVVNWLLEHNVPIDYVRDANRLYKEGFISSEEAEKIKEEELARFWEKM